MTSFSLATISTPDGDRATLVVNQRHYRLDRLSPDAPATGLRPLMEDWDGLMARASALAGLIASGGGEHAHVAAPSLLAPLRFPDKLVCVGAVYGDHLEQMGLPPKRWPIMPIFLRPPTTSIVGPGRTVRIPAMTKQFDWEVELAVVLGKHLRDASETEAESAVAGYTVGVDFSCRDLTNRDSPVGADLVRAKAQDTMGPIGPVLMPAQFVGDVQDLKLQLWVNGEQRQNGSTRTMLYSVAEQLATISRFVSLAPGDVVFTGSPAGSAHGRFPYLNAGDKVRAEIERVGVLELELYAAEVAA
jgi:2-keto-4-pentenoate hydratase/2-oxohepta-3-ene-1,7-dioic acid hydratase in catechol pathway